MFTCFMAVINLLFSEYFSYDAVLHEWEMTTAAVIAADEDNIR